MLRRPSLAPLVAVAERTVRSHPRAYAAFYAATSRSRAGLALASALKRSARRRSGDRVVACSPPDDARVVDRRRSAVAARLGLPR